MLRRGAWLTELDNELSMSKYKANFMDIESIPSGKQVVPWTCGAGKTSAIRRYIVNNIHNIDGVFSTKLIDDVDLMYYDILSQYMYITGDNVIPTTVVKYHSGSNLSISDLQSASWILCTHNRLFMEPPTILMMIETLSSSNINSNIYRDILFIDEYPVSLYRYVQIKDLDALEHFDYVCGTNKVNNPNKKYRIRNQYLKDAYNLDSKIDPVKESMLNKLDCTMPSNYSYNTDKIRGFDNDRSEMNRIRLGFFTDFFLRKLDEYKSITPIEDRSGTDRLYYSIKDYLIPNVYIFDGTGDILFKESKMFNICDSKYKRELSVNNVYTVHSDISRKSSSYDIVEEYSRIINTICNDNPDKNILVYTWKSSKNKKDIDNNDDLILDKIIKSIGDNSNRVEIISYMSGMERVTSEYSNSDILLVLGKFYIPGSVINEINKILSTSLTNEEYIESLIIQCIYRTKARNNETIDIYFTDDHSNCLINKIMYDCNCSNYNIIDYDERNRLINLLDNKLYSSSEISSILGYNRTQNNKVKDKLDSLDIPYEYTEGTGGGR